MSERRGVRAPREDGAIVADPPLRDVGRVLSVNQSRFPPTRELLGQPWPELRLQARQSALATAQAYMAGRGEPLPQIDAGGPFFLAGHQPELFHPGVWVKNFALCGLAQSHGGVALNLIVDNDTVKQISLRLPHPPEHSYPYLVSVPFDRWSGEVPWEERTIQDAALFAGFAEQALPLLRPWGYEPILGNFWSEVRQLANQDPHAGACFAAARRSLERAWGCHNLEVPLSLLCATEPFAWFACHLLVDLPRFHGAYNGCLADYRRHHHIDSRNHPVPNLGTDGEWLEAPLWGWRRDQKRRGRLMVRRSEGRLELRCGSDMWPSLPLADLPSGFRDLQAHGCKIRSRALTTTMYARLFLADLFIHGIGGGKYDELTDAICRNFYGFAPPDYLVLSATRLLPLPGYPATSEERRRLIRQVRDSVWNPDRLLQPDADPVVQSLVADKQAWIARTTQAPAEQRARDRKLRSLNASLAQALGDRQQQLRQELVDCERQLAANVVLRRRDYAFCLYPEAALRPFCSAFLDP